MNHDEGVKFAAISRAAHVLACIHVHGLQMPQSSQTYRQMAELS